MKPAVYIETTIPSLLTAWPSGELQIAAQQVATRNWWITRRKAFELYVSPVVLAEAGRGDDDAARLRLDALAECKVLVVSAVARQLTKRILQTGLIPPRAAADAAHIGLAAAHGMDFLLTWNCRHIHNSFNERSLGGICEEMGLSLPVLCTPLELMVDSLDR
jgi:hypothetical protein